MDREPDYVSLSDDDLADVARHLDRELHPGRWDRLQTEIARRPSRAAVTKTSDFERAMLRQDFITIGCLVGFALFALGVLLLGSRSQHPLGFLLLLIGVPLFGASLLCSWLWAFRCPRCSRNLSAMIMRIGNRSGNGPIRYCSYCGLDLDSKPMDGAADLA